MYELFFQLIEDDQQTNKTCSWKGGIPSVVPQGTPPCDSSGVTDISWTAFYPLGDVLRPFGCSLSHSPLRCGKDDYVLWGYSLCGGHLGEAENVC